MIKKPIVDTQRKVRLSIGEEVMMMTLEEARALHEALDNLLKTAPPEREDPVDSALEEMAEDFEEVLGLFENLCQKHAEMDEVSTKNSSPWNSSIYSFSSSKK